jgi:hypothetical protein
VIIVFMRWSMAGTGQAGVKRASMSGQGGWSPTLTRESRQADGALTPRSHAGRMLKPEELPLPTDEDPIDDEDVFGWGRLPRLEREEDGPPSDYRPFRDDPE